MVKSAKCAKVKSIIPKEFKNNIWEMQKLINQINGDDAPDIMIVAPKVVAIQNRVREFYNKLKILVTFDKFWEFVAQTQLQLQSQSQTQQQTWKTEFADFFSDIEAAYPFVKEPRERELRDIVPLQVLSSLDGTCDDAAATEAVATLYRQLQVCPLVSKIIETANLLAAFKCEIMRIYTPDVEVERMRKAEEKASVIQKKKNKIEPAGAASSFAIPSSETNAKDSVLDGWIYQEPGHLRPFAWSSMDIKYLWSHDDNQFGNSVRKLMLKLMAHWYWIGLYINETITSPNIDIGHMSTLIVEQITSYKKQIRGCNRAFKALEDAAGLLESNFTSYYRDSVGSSNKNYIIESFIMDVAQTNFEDKSLIVELKTIFIAIKNKISRSESQLPQEAQGILGMLDKLLGTEVPEETSDPNDTSETDVTNLDG